MLQIPSIACLPSAMMPARLGLGVWVADATIMVARPRRAPVTTTSPMRCR
ncbi:hypothetical protein IMZ48_40130 [Candidatus Bathyarchaeota archaeon]|nr:hypothetical protein [Candidatus Bathyarchaeota archaeon]